MTITSKLKQWQKLKTKLNAIQAEERELRKEIAKEILADKLEGAVTIHDGKFKATATATLNRNLDQAALESIWDDLTWEEQQCVEYRPKLVLGKYKQYEATESQLLEVVTVKPGTPQLKVEIA